MAESQAGRYRLSKVCAADLVPAAAALSIPVENLIASLIRAPVHDFV